MVGRCYGAARRTKALREECLVAEGKGWLGGEDEHGGRAQGSVDRRNRQLC